MLVALAPAGEHLLRAVSEVVAAGLAAIDALPAETRARSRWSLGSAKAALDLVSRLAVAGAERARRQARETLKAETAREILAALDARSGRLDGRAADALRTVRFAVAGALGLDETRVDRDRDSGGDTARSRPRTVERAAPRSRAAARRGSGRQRRIPTVSFEDPGDE